MCPSRSSSVAMVHRINPLQKRICSIEFELSPKASPKDLGGHMWPGGRKIPTPALEVPGLSPGGSLES